MALVLFTDVPGFEVITTKTRLKRCRCSQLNNLKRLNLTQSTDT